ncbi:hypothetical protein ACOME3_010062 [Neoechinorhynchus agilis]
MEKAHDISIDEPTVAHQAILFILDVLIRNDQEMNIEGLYNTFGDQAFTPQMLRAVGGNEQGLRNFLVKYPSLFTINGNTVTATSGNPIRASLAHTKPRSSMKNENEQPMWDVKTMKEIEQEAIAFFKKQMVRKEEEWLPIVSVAGHASQASPDIRKFVGPQNEFVHFLMRYPMIFVVRDEFCGLKGKADLPGVRFPPPSPPPKRKSADNVAASRSFKLAPKNFGPVGQQVHPHLTPTEVKAVHYVMRLLYKCGRILVRNVSSLLTRAPEQISKTVGLTKDDLVLFFKRHGAIFQLHPDGCVSVKSDAVRALIHKDKSLTENSVFTSTGIILRIFPKYGILNMENNEQVFFDIQSCQFESFGDLTCILHPGDRLWFNAILGPKDGSTKWRSLKTWIKMKPQQFTDDFSNAESPAQSMSNSSMTVSSKSSMNAATEELYQYRLDGLDGSSEDDSGNSQAGSLNASQINTNSKSSSLIDLRSVVQTASVSLLHRNGGDSLSEIRSPSLDTLQQQLSACNGCLNPDAIRSQIHSKALDDGISKRELINEKIASSPCQTISSGDILATNIFIE